MIISRLPKSCASTENAPGPNKASAVTIVAVRMTGSFASNSDGLHDGSKDIVTATPATATHIHTRGMRNPASIKAPAAAAERPISQVDAEGAGSRT